MYNNCVCIDDVINIVTRTLPATYVYGIYRHAHSARNVRIWDLSSRAKLWNDSMRFRIIVYTHVTMATGSINELCHVRIIYELEFWEGM